MFKVGDKVKCIDDSDVTRSYTVKKGTVYTVERISKNSIAVKETPIGWYNKWRFENITRKLKLERILRCSK